LRFETKRFDTTHWPRLRNNKHRYRHRRRLRIDEIDPDHLEEDLLLVELIIITRAATTT
jgi:hypothetical protein